MWPLKLIVSEKQALFLGFQHTFMGFSKEIDGKTFIFRVNLGMWSLKSIMTGKSPVLTVSIHIYRVSKEIDGKTFIFRVNLGMWPLKLIVSEKQALFWGFHHTLWGFQGDTWEIVHCRVNLGNVTSQINCVRKTSPVLRVSLDIYGVSKEIDGKTFIFRVNLGMWSLKSIILENWVLFWGFHHTFVGFPRR